MLKYIILMDSRGTYTSPEYKTMIYLSKAFIFDCLLFFWYTFDTRHKPYGVTFIRLECKYSRSEYQPAISWAFILFLLYYFSLILILLYIFFWLFLSFLIYFWYKVQPLRASPLNKIVLKKRKFQGQNISHKFIVAFILSLTRRKTILNGGGEWYLISELSIFL